MVHYSFKQNKKLKKLISWATLLLYLGQPVFVAAQVVADPNAAANNKPTIETTANGLPMVQIATPSAAGVSRNLYQQFDIGTHGIILNNANGVTNTQLAGYVYGNPNLANGMARIILNEVTGSSISQLNGYLEVAGQKAQVIIANPNGIAVNGFGFLNTSRGVLTTGTPIFGGTGSLDAFRVTGGQISIQGAGLDASTTDRAELISRTVSANAGIWAKDVSVITGSNKVDYETLATEKLAQPDEGITVALDVGALGGMYANKIKLIGTEKGVGVNSQGTFAASGGDLTLTNEGKVILAGNVSSSSNLTITTPAEVENKGSLYAQHGVVVHTDSALTNDGNLSAGQDAVIKAKSIFSNGTIGAGIKDDGTLGITGNLTLTADDGIIIQGKNTAAGSLTETAAFLDHWGSNTYAGENANLTAAQGDILHTGAVLEAKGALTIMASGSVNNDQNMSVAKGQITAGKLTINAAAISNRGGVIQQSGTDTTQLSAVTVDNTGGQIATNGNTFALTTNNFINDQGQIQHAGTDRLELKSTDALQSNGGKIVSNGRVDIETQNLDNVQGIIAAQKQVSVTTNNITNEKGTLTSGDSLKIHADGTIDNEQGTAQAGNGLVVTANTLNNTSGQLTNLSNADTKVTIDKGIINQAGLIGGNGKVWAIGETLDNKNGKILAKDQLDLTIQNANNNNGTLSAGQDLLLHQGHAALTNLSGYIGAGNNLTLESGDVDNTLGTIEATKDVTLSGQSLTGSSTLLAGRDLTLTFSGNLTNLLNGSMKANRNLLLQAEDITNDGSLLAVDTLTITGKNITLGNHAVTASGNILNVNAAENIENNGRVGSAAVSFNGQKLSNQGVITAGGLTIDVATLENNGAAALMSSTGDMQIGGSGNTQSISNQGNIYAQGNDTLNAVGTINNTGVIAAGQDNVLTAGSLSSTGTLGAGINSDGTVDNTGNLTLTVTGALNAQGKNLAGANLIETGATIDHRDAVTYAGKDAVLTATQGDFEHTGGQLQANGALTIHAQGVLTNDKDATGKAGKIIADQMNITSKDISNQGGSLLQTGTGDTGIAAQGSLNNTSGTIATNGQLALTSGTVDSTQGSITAKGKVTVNAAALTNDQGVVAAGDAMALAVQNDVSNRQGTIEAAKQLTLGASSLANQGGSITSLDDSGLTITSVNAIDNTSGTLGSNGAVDITSYDLINTLGKIIAQNNLNGKISHVFSNQNGSIFAGQDVVIGQTSPLENISNTDQGSITAGRNLLLAANVIDNQDGHLFANQDITLTGDSINAGGSATAGRDITLNANGDITAQAGAEIAANHNMAVNANTFTSVGSFVAVQDMTLTANSITNDTEARVASGAMLSLSGQKLINAGSISGSQLTANVRTIDNSGTMLADSLGITGDSVTNRGSQARITANKSLDLIATSTFENMDGALLFNAAADKGLTLNTGILTNSGSILSGKDAGITAQTINSNGAIGAGINADGTIGSVGDLTLTSDGTISAKGRNLAAHTLTMKGQAIDLGGAKTAAGSDIHLTATAGKIDNSAGVLQADDTLYAEANGQFINDNAGMQAQQVNLTLGSFSNVGGKLLQTGTSDTVIHTASIDNTAGTIATNGASLTLEADMLKNKQGTIIQTGEGNLKLTTPGDLDNFNGTIKSNGTISITAANLDNTKGMVAGQQGLAFISTGLVNDQGNIVTKGAMNLQVQNDLSSQQGMIEAGKALTVTAQNIKNQGGSMTSLDNSGLKLIALQTINNTSGTIGANGDVTLTSANLINQTGKILTKGTLYADVTETLNNTSGQMTADQDVTLGRNIAVNSLTNTQGSITAGTSLLMKASAANNTNGKLAANLDINNTITDLNGVGSITAGQNLILKLGGDFINESGANVIANRDLTLTAANVTNNGSMAAVSNVKITANNVINGTGATLEGGTGLTIAAIGDVNNSGVLQSGIVDINGKNINNTGAVFGNTLTITADTITNANNTAVIATTQDMKLFAKTSLENKDDATIYGMGNITIAGSKNLDGNGEYIDKVVSMLNQSAVIEADKDIRIYANTVINKKREFEMEQKIVSDENYITLCDYLSGDGWTAGTYNGYRVFMGDARYAITPLTGGFFQNAIFILGETITEDKLVVDSPKGEIISGNNMMLRTDNITNDNSWIISNGIINSSGTVNNIATGNVRIITRHLVDATEFFDTPAWHAEKLYDDIEYEQLSSESTLFGGGQTVTINAVNVNNITVAPGTIQTGTVNKLTSSGQTNRTDSIQSNTGTYNAGVQASSGSTGVVAKNASTTNQSVAASGQASGAGVGQQDHTSIQTISINTPDTTKVNTSGVPIENMQTLLPIAKDTTATTVKQTSDSTITIPANALYKTHTEPSAKYLVETDSRFTSYGNFVSSDYMLQRLNVDPTKVEKRLGDGFYEQKLVRDQVTELTGRYTLSGYSSTEEQYKALLNSGVTYAQQYNLQVGVALSADQMAQLTSDIVWLVEKEVDGQKVLVPQVYLVQGHVLKDSGALITGDNVAINATGNVTNAGSITGKDSVQINAANITNYGGTISSDNLVKLDAKEDLFNFSGVISGTQVGLTVGQDLKNETVSITSTLPFMTNAVTSKVADITAKQDLALHVGQDTSIIGATLNAGQNLSLLTGNDLTVDSVKTQNKLSAGSYLDDKVTNLVSSISAGNNMALTANQDIDMKGVQINAGKDLNLISGGNINLSAVKDEKIHDQTYGGSSNWTRIMTDDETAIGSNLQAGNNLVVAAVKIPAVSVADSGNVSIAGSSVSSKAGAVSISGTKDVTIEDVTEKHEKLVVTHKKDSGFFSSTTRDTRDYSLINEVKGSTVSGDSVKVAANNDVNVIASNIVGTNDVNLVAGNDVNITSAAETGKDDHYSKTTTSGIFGGGGFLGITIGSKSETSNLAEKTLDQIGSTVGSVNGNVNISAGNDVNSAGTTFVSGKDLNILGKDISIDNTINTYDSQYNYEFKQSGLSISLGGGIVSAVNNATSDISRTGEVEDDRLKALYAYKAAQDIKKVADNVKNGETGVSIGVSIGSSSSTYEQTVHAETVNISNINAGGDVNLKATEGDINLIGTKINANDINIEAIKNINIAGAQNREQTDSKSSYSSWSLGGSIGVGFNGSFGSSSGTENGNSVTNVGSVLNATDTTTIKSGQDTNIIGSKVQGEKIVADVGGNLNIASKQDTNDYTSNSSSIGVGFGTGKSSGTTGSFSKGNIDSTYDSVTGQAGIYAGKEGFDINVGKNTDLNGAVIASTATPDKNKLSTDTLTFSDIQNKAEYSASSSGYSLDTITTIKKGTDENGKQTLVPEKSLSVSPDIGMPVSGSASSTTKSGISQGTIIVRSGNTVLSNLNRNTTNSVNALGKIFDKKTVQEQQELTKVFGQEAYKAIGDISLAQYTKALDDADKAKKSGDTAAYNEAMARADSWHDGGANKILLHAIAGGIMSDLGGGSFSSGAASAGLNEAVQNELAKIKDPGLHQLASVAIGAVASKIAGGNAQTGTSAALSGTKYNWLTHEQQQEMAKLLNAATSTQQKENIIAYYTALSQFNVDNNPKSINDWEAIEPELLDVLHEFTSRTDNGLNYSLNELTVNILGVTETANIYRAGINTYGTSFNPFQGISTQANLSVAGAAASTSAASQSTTTLIDYTKIPGNYHYENGVLLKTGDNSSQDLSQLIGTGRRVWARAENGTAGWWNIIQGNDGQPVMSWAGTTGQTAISNGGVYTIDANGNDSFVRNATMQEIVGDENKKIIDENDNLLLLAMGGREGGIGLNKSTSKNITTVGNTGSVIEGASKAATELEITNPVLGKQRIGSGLKVDEIKPITAKDAKGREFIVREFPPTAQGHGFTDIVDNYAGYASEFTLKNGAKLYQVEGSLNGAAGRFEWIVDSGNVTHRMFVEGGTVNGVPIK